MTLSFSVFEIILLLLLFVWFFFFIVQAYNIVFRGFAPYVSTRKKIIDDVLRNIEKNGKFTLVELGCGRAGFLQAARGKFPEASLVGFEYSFWPLFQAKVRNWIKKSNLVLKKQNIYTVDLSQADIVYCYLNPQMMAELGSKFKAELKKEAVIISYQFSIPEMTPIKEIQEKGSSERIYFYKI
jgi:hypothetical protein